jgi:hypothetical protein
MLPNQGARSAAAGSDADAGKGAPSVALSFGQLVLEDRQDGPALILVEGAEREQPMATPDLSERGGDGRVDEAFGRRAADTVAAA